MTTSCCMCDLVRTAQSFGDDAHAVATGLHLGMSGLHSVVWSVSVGGKPVSPMGARTRTRAMLNVRQRPLVVNATGAIQKNNTLIDPEPRTPKQATTPISKCPQLSHTHAVELATLKRSLLDAVKHFLFPTSLFLSVFLHVFALSSSLGMNILLNAFPLSSSSTPPLSSSLTFISSAFPS